MRFAVHVSGPGDHGAFWLLLRPHAPIISQLKDAAALMQAVSRITEIQNEKEAHAITKWLTVWLTLRKAVTLSIGLGVHLALVWPACAALESGVYQTVPDATVEERGDAVQSGSRVVFLSASLTFDLNAAEPSLTAVISNAVLEGGALFALTVRSSSGTQVSDGTYRFTGDYLQEIEPSGTQYLFEWNFSMATNGLIVWNGTIDWAGGHIWQVTISDVAILKDTTRPKLDIMEAGSQVVVSWPTNYPGFSLEQATSLLANDWGTVTNTVATTSDRFSVTVQPAAAQRFFRLSNQRP